MLARILVDIGSGLSSMLRSDIVASDPAGATEPALAISGSSALAFLPKRCLLGRGTSSGAKGAAKSAP